MDFAHRLCLRLCGAVRRLSLDGRVAANIIKNMHSDCLQQRKLGYCQTSLIQSASQSGRSLQKECWHAGVSKCVDAIVRMLG